MRWLRTQRSEFERLLQPHLNHLYRLAYRFTGQPSDAEDLVQDLLVKLYPRTEELAGMDNLRTWLTRVLYNHFIDMTRQRARSPHGNLEALPESEHGDPLDLLHGEAPDPADEVDRVLTQRVLLQALDTLSAENRALLTMHEMEGYSLKELQALFDMPLGTLKSRLSRARQALKQALGWEPNVAVQRVYTREVEKWTVAK